MFKKGLREDVENFAEVLEHPDNAGNVSKAVNSGRNLLTYAKAFTDIGMQVSHPLRKRIFSSRTLESGSALALIVATIGPLIMYLLHALWLLG